MSPQYLFNKIFKNPVNICLVFVFISVVVKSQTHYQSSLDFFNQGNTTMAIEEITRYINSHPNQTDGWELRAFYYMQLSSKEQAISDYTRALELDNDLIGSLTNRALLYMEVERYTLALKDLDRKVALLPKDPASYFDRAYCYALMENYDQALNDFDTCIHLDPSNASAYANRGFTKINQISNEGLIRPAPEECTEACIDLEKALAMGDSSVVKMIQLYCP